MTNYRIYKPLLTDTVYIPVSVQYRGVDRNGNSFHEVLFDRHVAFQMEVPAELKPQVWESLIGQWFFEINLPGEILERYDITNPSPQKGLPTYKAKGKLYAYLDWGGIRFRFPLVSDSEIARKKK